MARDMKRWFDNSSDGRVECLGMTFENDDARRAHFLDKLRAKLKDRAFRKSAGFPIGEDDDILALSDPPYYTACSNPFLDMFVKYRGDNCEPDDTDYHQEPFAVDVSEGKNDPIYNAHSYHTKVPYKAIMRYILHYTNPGEIVLDGFCGTGMTGVAAQLCGDRNVVESLGFTVKADGTILDKDGNRFSKIGSRCAILSDLSPGATFIASNYNSPFRHSVRAFEDQAEQIVETLEAEFGHLFHRPGTKQPLEYSVWSDVFICPNCSTELCYWDLAVDTKHWKIRDELKCSECGSAIQRTDMERAWVTSYDPVSQESVRRAKKVRVWDVWKVGGQRREGPVLGRDRTHIDELPGVTLHNWCPTSQIPKGDKTGDPYGSGITRVHQYWTPRTCAVLARFRDLASETALQNMLWFVMTSALDRVSLRNGYRPQHKLNKSRELGGPLPGNLYIPIFGVELNPLIHLRDRIKSVARMLEASCRRGSCFVTTQDTASLDLPDESVDYVFVDPPFGSNLMYSELSFAMESWLRVTTNNGPEAIVNDTQNKDERSYTDLMYECFIKLEKVLKPGRWITVEFHNSRNSIWTAIQEALTHAGFVVADVRVLSRNLGSLNQITALNAVKQDLIISAYKPESELEEGFRMKAGTEAGVWEFVGHHLRQLPVFVSKSRKVEALAERQNYLLFDRMVAFHVQRGVTVPFSASEFYAGLRQRFPERDGMYFLPEQVTEYDRRRLEVKEIEQLELFVSDEKSAIQWVRRLLSEKPMDYGRLQPLYMKEAQRVWEKHEQPLELQTILDQNFVRDGDGTWRVPDPKREADLEQLRHRALIKEFAQYQESRGKLKLVRSEALRAGFKECWDQQNYAAIIEMAKRVPETVIQEDWALLMYYDNARMQTGQ